MLTWKRGKVTGNNGFGHHTTHETTLSNGQSVLIKSVEGSFFFYVGGKATGGFTNSLKEAKAAIQRVEDKISK